jgi:hypothetical protein
MLGEGKPENQNHAIIFTRGEGLQTIDMNQVCIPPTPTPPTTPATVSVTVFLLCQFIIIGTLYGGDFENEEFVARVSEET